MNGIVLYPTWIVPVDREATHNGCLVIMDGVLEFVGNELPPRYSGLPSRTLARTAILPGWINAHCHLEFSDLEQPIPCRGAFCTWLADVMRHRSAYLQASDEERWEMRRTAIQRGLKESWESGTRWIIDNVTTPWHPQWIQEWNEEIASRLPPFLRESLTPKYSAIVQPCPEIIDVQPLRFEQTTQLLFEQFAAPKFSGVVAAGIAPHAPYTASLDAVAFATKRSSEENRLVTMHLAETLEEIEWLDHRTGILAEWIRPRLSEAHLARVGTVTQHLEALSRATRSLVVHGNYLNLDQSRRIASKRSNMAVVVCPRTHDWFAHPPHPLDALLEDGGNVFLGTDSKASNPNLELWPEAQTVQQWHPDWEPQRIASLITTKPSAFLKDKSAIGTLKPGAESLLTAFCWGEEQATTDPANEKELWRGLMAHGKPIPLELHPQLQDNHRS